MNPKAKALYDKHDKEWFAERVVELEEAIKKVLDDESADDGWGPDVTTVSYLQEALKGRDNKTE